MPTDLEESYADLNEMCADLFSAMGMESPSREDFDKLMGPLLRQAKTEGDAVDLSWTPFNTEVGTVGAVNEAGHKLYGEEAKNALNAQHLRSTAQQFKVQPAQTPAGIKAGASAFRKPHDIKTAPQATPADEAKAEEEATKATGDNNKRVAKDGTLWVRAPKGGAVSDVNGKAYKGGRWMPIHGLSVPQPAAPKGQGKGSPPPKPNEDGKGRQARQPMTPEQIEEERQRREERAKWTKINTGIIGKFKWLGESPNHKAMEPGTNVKQWKEFAESIGEEKVKKIVDVLKAEWDAHVDQEAQKDALKGLPEENIAWYRDQPRREAENAESIVPGAKKHLKTTPSSLLARGYIEAALGNINTVDGLYQLEQTLKGIVEGGGDGGEEARLSSAPSFDDDASFVIGRGLAANQAFTDELAGELRRRLEAKKE